MKDITKQADTQKRFQEIITHCKSIFIKKHSDYGVSWYILRLPSITDQIFIKATRIRSIQEKSKQLIKDPIDTEFIGIVNYCIMALIKHDFPQNIEKSPSLADVSEMYDKVVQNNLTLLQNKNHDYDEAWTKMRLGSMVDIILVKLLRIKHIEDNPHNLSISEGVDANYRDIINYSVFSLIKIIDSGGVSIV